MRKMKKLSLGVLLMGVVSMILMSSGFLFRDVHAEDVLTLNPDSEIVETIDSESAEPTESVEPVEDEVPLESVVPIEEGAETTSVVEGLSIPPASDPVPFAATAVIDGIVVDDAAQPVANLAIELRNHTDHSTTTTTTDASGYYKFENLEPGDYGILPLTTKYHFIVGLGDILADGEHKTINIDVRRAFTTVSGYAFSIFEENLPSLEVRLVSTDGQTVLTTTTDSTGAFTFTEVIFGDYTIEADLPGYYTFLESVFTVDNPNPMAYDLIMWHIVDIGGSVVDTQGQPISDASVMIMFDLGAFGLIEDYSEFFPVITTDANGQFFLGDSLPFDTQVKVSAPGYKTATSDLRAIDTGGLHTFNIVLEKENENEGSGTAPAASNEASGKSTEKTLPQTGGTLLLSTGLFSLLGGALILRNKKNN